MIYPARNQNALDNYVLASEFIRARDIFDSDQYQDSISVLDRCVSESTPLSTGVTVTVAECWLLIAWNAQRMGDYNTASALLDWLTESGCAGYDVRGAFVLRCYLDLVDGRYEEVLNLVEDQICHSVSNNRLNIHDLLICRGFARYRLGCIEDARPDFEAGYEISRIQGLSSWMVDHANYCGVVEARQGRYERAIDWYLRALEPARSLGALARLGRLYLNQGICEYKIARYASALMTLESAANSLKKSQDKANLTRTQIALGNVHRLTRNHTTARQHLTQAYTMATEIKIPREECLALEFLGDVYRDEGKPEEARRYYQRGMAIAMDIAPEGDLVMELLRREGECFLHEGKPGKGLEILARALTRTRKLGDRFEEGVVLRCLAEGLLTTGDHDQALDYAEQAATQLEDIDARHEHAIACLTAGEILLQLSEQAATTDPRDCLDKAWGHSLVAQAICRQLDIEYWTNAVKRLQSRIARRRAEEVRYATARERPERGTTYQPGDVIIAESRAMLEVLQVVEAFAPYNEPVLLTGETGTGKEVIAKRVHELSLRKDKPFVAVNVTAIPQSMFEREFFGHTKGAFSGADSDRLGLAAAADGGTLFLDEIGELPSAIQAKFLRLLQDGSYHCLGDPAERRADLRIIAATNVELETAVRAGEFREDLYYRLAILTIPLPPLREHPEDIRPLLDHFLSLSAGRQATSEHYFNEVSLRLLAGYGWPGNVREVALVARRAYISLRTFDRVEITVGTDGDAMVLRGPGQEAAQAAAAGGGDDPEPLSRARILLALEETGGNRTAAARRLGVARATFYRRLAKLGLD